MLLGGEFCLSPQGEPRSNDGFLVSCSVKCALPLHFGFISAPPPQVACALIEALSAPPLYQAPACSEICGSQHEQERTAFPEGLSVGSEFLLNFGLCRSLVAQPSTVQAVLEEIFRGMCSTTAFER